MLWSNRFEKKLSERAFDFSTSIRFDTAMFLEDIEQNSAHSKMLNSIGIINDSELKEILLGLEKIKEDFEKRGITDLDKFEDVHSLIEIKLKENIGATADKIHSGRSRNDQVATIFRMWIRKNISSILSALEELQKAILLISERHVETVIPGYTHLQRAQPVSLAHHFLAYFQMFERDKKRFQFTLSETNNSPLGSGALAGASLPLNREFTMRELKFSDLCTNSMDAVSDRDFALDFLNCVSIGMMHLSRLSEEMITWSSQEWNFMTFDDEYSTGSSLMPQKKNPDITELIRGKTARVFGNQFTLLSILKGLPLSYNRDLQEDKEPVFDSFNQYFNALNLMKAIIKSAKFNKNRFVEELNGDYIFATDIAEWLVKQGIPFREAHGIVGQLVKHAVSEKKSLNELSLDEYRKFSPLFDESVYNLCSVEGCLERKITYGSPNPKLVLKQIMDYKKLLGM